MNRQIATLFRIAAVGFALLITMTAYWQIWAASSLASRRDNARLVYRQLQIRRGLILASNGRTVLARNHPVHQNGLTLYTRRYPFGPLFAHAVGYNTVGDGRTALELAENPYLTASNSDLATVISNLGSTLRGETVTGDNVITSLSVPGAEGGRSRRCEGQHLTGAVIALEPSTGRVVAMYSSPSFNPTNVQQNFPHLSTRGGAPLLNRATQGLYAPGSTFKIVTATSALNAGFTPAQLTFDAGGHCITVEAHPLCNAGTESFGTIDLGTRAHELGQYLLRPARPEARADQARGHDAEVRVLSAAAVHLPDRRDEPERPLLQRAADRDERARSTSAGSRSARSGWLSRRCRWPRWRRRSETAACGWRRSSWTRWSPAPATPSTRAGRRRSSA